MAIGEWCIAGRRYDRQAERSRGAWRMAPQGSGKTAMVSQYCMYGNEAREGSRYSGALSRRPTLDGWDGMGMDGTQWDDGEGRRKQTAMDVWVKGMCCVAVWPRLRLRLLGLAQKETAGRRAWARAIGRPGNAAHCAYKASEVAAEHTLDLHQPTSQPVRRCARAPAPTAPPRLRSFNPASIAQSSFHHTPLPSLSFSLTTVARFRLPPPPFLPAQKTFSQRRPPV